MPIALQAEADDPLVVERELSIDDSDWLVLRVTDPALPPDHEAQGAYAEAGAAVAYASPFFLQAPAQGPAPVATTPAPHPQTGLPATGGGSSAIGLGLLALGGAAAATIGRRSQRHG